MAILDKPLSSQKKREMLERVAFHTKARQLRDERIKNGSASKKDIESYESENRRFESAKKGVLIELIESEQGADIGE